MLWKKVSRAGAVGSTKATRKLGRWRKWRSSSKTHDSSLCQSSRYQRRRLSNTPSAKLRVIRRRYLKLFFYLFILLPSSWIPVQPVGSPIQDFFGCWTGKPIFLVSHITWECGNMLPSAARSIALAKFCKYQMCAKTALAVLKFPSSAKKSSWTSNTCWKFSIGFKNIFLWFDMARFCFERTWETYIEQEVTESFCLDADPILIYNYSIC